MKTKQKPSWLRKKISIKDNAKMKDLLSSQSLHTICEEALCPNISECFRRQQASFLILGNRCTRECQFCNVEKGRPLPPDAQTIPKLADTIRQLALKHVVITSPTRDDLSDGGASFFVETVTHLKQELPDLSVELLIPDFQGNKSSLKMIAATNIEILGHNVETVPSLYAIRKGAIYQRSLEVLQTIGEMAPNTKIKSGIMLGLGENESEVISLFDDLRKVKCSLLSIGQYLAPSKTCYPVQDYITPEKFDYYKQKALQCGFTHVESGPYVRSSYHAEDYIK